MPSREMKWLVKHPCGLFTVAVVYLIFLHIYASTVYFSIVPYLSNSVSAYFNLFFLTIFTILALISHVKCMLTNPGMLPKGYKELNEEKITLKMAKLLDERESLYISPQIRKLSRSGKVEEAKQLQYEHDRQSIYSKAKQIVKDGNSTVHNGSSEDDSISRRLKSVPINDDKGNEDNQSHFDESYKRNQTEDNKIGLLQAKVTSEESRPQSSNTFTTLSKKNLKILDAVFCCSQKRLRINDSLPSSK